MSEFKLTSRNFHVFLEWLKLVETHTAAAEFIFSKIEGLRESVPSQEIEIIRGLGNRHLSIAMDNTTKLLHGLNHMLSGTK